MDSRLFSPESPGLLVHAPATNGNCAFLPEPLPADWEMPDSLWPLLLDAREQIARLDGVGRHMPNHGLLLRPLQQREALRSSSMEGTYATPEELLLYQAEPREPQSATDRANEWREVWNYDRALTVGQQMLDDGYPLSLQLIRALHAELLSGVRGHDKSPGQFRRLQVQVGADARFVPPPPQQLPDCLAELERSMQEASSIDPLVRSFMVHYQFETIHPFVDGNGRVGRLLLSLQIYKCLNLTSPWLYMSAFFERFKDEYIDRLFGVSARKDWTRWTELCLRGAASQARDAIARFDQLVEIRDRFRQQVAEEAGASARLHAIVDSLLESPLTTVPGLQRRFNVTYPTAKADVDRLRKLGVLSPGPRHMRPRYYFSPDIMRVAYSDPTS